jgi:hypothetical protein
MAIDISGEISKMIAEKNKENSKDEKKDPTELSDFQKSKIRDLERSVDDVKEAYYKLQREMKSTDSALSSLDIDFDDIAKDIEMEIKNTIK